MNPDWNSAWQLVLEEKWLPLAIFVVGYLVRLTASDSKFPINVPSQWQPVIALALAELYGLLVAWPNWQKAANPAMLAALGVLIIKAYFYGREPAWLLRLAKVKKPANDNMTPVPAGDGEKHDKAA